jgi:hypothetical protein
MHRSFHSLSITYPREEAKTYALSIKCRLLAPRLACGFRGTNFQFSWPKSGGRLIFEYDVHSKSPEEQNEIDRIQ